MELCDRQHEQAEKLIKHYKLIWRILTLLLMCAIVLIGACVALLTTLDNGIAFGV